LRCCPKPDEKDGPAPPAVGPVSGELRDGNHHQLRGNDAGGHVDRGAVWRGLRHVLAGKRQHRPIGEMSLIVRGLLYNISPNQPVLDRGCAASGRNRCRHFRCNVGDRGCRSHARNRTLQRCPRGYCHGGKPRCRAEQFLSGLRGGLDKRSRRFSVPKPPRRSSHSSCYILAFPRRGQDSRKLRRLNACVARRGCR
jgi:hypothetical protein